MARDAISSTHPKYGTIRKRRLETWHILVMATVGVTIAAIVGVIILPLYSQSQEEKTIIELRQQREPIFDTTRLTNIALLHKIGVISSTQPDYSAKTDVCYVDHTDQGLITVDWYQDCYIRYVDLFATHYSRSAALNKLATVQTSQNPFGSPSYHPTNFTCDSLYEKNYLPTLIYYSEATSSAGTACKIPGQIQGPYSVRGPMLLDQDLAVNRIRAFDAQLVDPSKFYIIIQSDNYYYHSDLGCTIGLLCPSPRAKPLTGF